MKFHAALTRILRPLVRLMIARGVTFPDLSDLLKPIYVRCAEVDFGLEGKRMTDSRISLLTGLQRRDVRLNRDQEGDFRRGEESAGPLPRVIARWLSDETWLDGDREPLTLDRTGEQRSFDALVASISRDMHPRTLLDELNRQGAVAIEGDRITLTARSYLPNDDDAKLGYFGANLGDHTEAAAANLSEEEPPYFERAVHYNNLSEKAALELETLARKRQHEVLSELNAEALRLQDGGDQNGPRTSRFRCGAFIYLTNSDGEKR